jgi:hypothetical protein
MKKTYQELNICFRTASKNDLKDSMDLVNKKIFKFEGNGRNSHYVIK